MSLTFKELYRETGEIKVTQVFEIPYMNWNPQPFCE